MPPLGPTSEEYSDDDAVQKEFTQQRGLEEDSDGNKVDTRALADKIGEPISGPAGVKVYDESDGTSDGTSDSSFYGDDE